MVALIIIVVLVLWICVSCIKIVPQAQAYVIERLGAYQSTWNVGFKRAGSGFPTPARNHQG